MATQDVSGHAGRRAFRDWVSAQARLLHSAPWLIYVVVLLLGGLATWATFSPLHLAGKLKVLKDGGEISLTQDSVWMAALMLSTATALVTVSVFELLKLLLERFRRYIATRMAFNQFWGDGASSNGNEGVILLQEENIEEAVKALMPSARFDKPQIEDTDNRFFKAITWVNKYDAEAAKHIRAAFWKLGYGPPEMQHIRGATTHIVNPTTPFVISVGLFNKQTKCYVHDYSGDNRLMQIVQTQKGDALEIYRGLVNDPEFLAVSGHEMLQVTPRDWVREQWIKSESSTDFAIILRHTMIRRDSSKLVRFVVAGFTEQGTEAASYYLANEWRDLHREFWAETAYQDRRGDFFIIIVGKTNEVRGWTREPGINPITPKVMAHTHRNLAPTTLIERA